MFQKMERNDRATLIDIISELDIIVTASKAQIQNYSPFIIPALEALGATSSLNQIAKCNNSTVRIGKRQISIAPL